MEVTVGLNHGKQTVEPLTPGDFDRNLRGNAGLGGLPQFFPGANGAGIVPNVFFSNTTNVNATGQSPSGVGLANLSGMIAALIVPRFVSGDDSPALFTALFCVIVLVSGLLGGLLKEQFDELLIGGGAGTEA